MRRSSAGLVAILALLALLAQALTPGVARAQSSPTRPLAAPAFGDAPAFGAATAASRATAELMLDTDRLTPGQQGIAAVVVRVVDGWHAQSSQPLDESFIPFVVTLNADAPLRIEDVLYPPGELQDFPALGGKLSVYHGTILTFVPFVVPDDARPGDVTLTASVRLQACNDQTCDRPMTITATAKTRVVAATTGDRPTSQHADVFRQFDPMRWLHRHPTPEEAATQPAAAKVEAGLFAPYSDAALADARRGGKPVLVKFTAAWCVNCHVVERRVFGDAPTVAQLKERGVTLLKADLTQDGAPGSELLARLNPARSIPFTAVYFPGNDAPAGLTGIYSSADLLATLDDAGKTVTNATTIAGFDLATAPLGVKLLVAIGVGLLLNAVPCVLPVLPLKAMSFYEDAGHDRGRSMLNGLLFSLGIVATFGALALFVITQDALWGKFISHPITALVLTLVLLAAAAQAFGLFEFALPRFVTNLEARASAAPSPARASDGKVVLDYASDPPSIVSGLASNFFSGMLIAVLSTPCTIGVFAAVIAVAIAAGAGVGSLILMFVGVGMALPWFALSAFPEATRRFPRTGPWPGVVKQMTAFLLVATAVFFASPLLARAQIGQAAVWWLIFACVAAAAMFLLVRTAQIAPRPRPLAISGCIAGLLVAAGLSLTLMLTS